MYPFFQKQKKPINVSLNLSIIFTLGDDDSGTDENCDSPPLSPPSPPTSGFAMAKKMTVGVVSEESGNQESASKSADTNLTNDKLLYSNMGLLYSSQLPTTDTLAKLRQRKKVKIDFVLSWVYCSSFHLCALEPKPK